MKLRWSQIQTLTSKPFTCGYCGNSLTSEKGFQATFEDARNSVFIYVCHFCSKPTFFDLEGKQYPKAKAGTNINGITDESVSKLYEEARKAAGTEAPTATVMACRVILMHVAVAKGAKKNQSFEFYVDFLDKKGFVPTGLKSWAESIRKMGNKANHKIVIMTEEQAKNILRFTEVLLKIIYEMPEDLKIADNKDVKPKLEVTPS